MTSLEGNVTLDPMAYDYNYTYDYDESVNNPPLLEVVPETFVYVLTLALGILGNVLVIFSVSYYRRMRTVTNSFLLSLACADLLLVLICVPIKAVAFFSFTWQFGEVMCKLVHYVQSYSMICSVLTLTVISVERVVAVVFPLKAKYWCTMRHAQFVVLGVWVLSAALAVPTILIYIHLEVGTDRKAFWCIRNHLHSWWHRTYELYMLTLLFMVPVFSMVLAYAVIAVKVWHVSDIRAGGRVTSAPSDPRQKMMAKSDSGTLLGNETSGTKTTVAKNGRSSSKRQQRVPEENETRKQVVVMLVMVVVLFAICWGPILVSNVLTAWGHIDYLHYGYLKPMRQAFYLMSYFNSCLNPIVYAFFSRNFRQSFKMAICACVRGKAFVRAYRYSVSASTRASHYHHSNGRTLTSVYERDGATGSSGENENGVNGMAASVPESVEMMTM